MVGIVNKPDINYGIWASNGDVAVPSSEKVEIGHIVEKPKKEIVNWIENRQDQFMAYLNQVGIPEWDSKTTYKANISFVNRSGTVYKAKSQNIDKDPTLNQDIWEISWATYSDFYNLSNRVESIETVDEYLDFYVSKANPEFTVETKGVGYNDTTDSSGFSFESTTPIVINNGSVVARFSEEMSIEDTSKSVATTEWVQDLIKSTMDAIVPIGSIIDYPSLVFNSELFLPCNGQEISRTTYQDLFSVIGTMYGVGNGSTTFNVPDYRGTFRRTADLGKGLDNGRVVGSYQSDAIRKITGWSAYGMDSDVSQVTDFMLQAGGAFKMSDEVYYDGLNNASWTNLPSYNRWRRLELDTSRSVPTASENRPVNIAVQTLIRAK